MKVLTIVIPAYNVEKYVDQIFSSLLIPEIEEDIEILFINDGSSDRSSELAKKYAIIHPSIRVIDKENGGHGSVINYGIKEASGKYIKVVDGDDYVEKDGTVKLVNSLKNIDVDLVLNTFYRVDAITGKKKLQAKQMLTPQKVYLYKDVFEEIGRIQMHAMTYRTELLRKNHISFTEKCFYEDFEYTLFPMFYAKDIVYIENPVYNYVVGQQEQSVNAKKTLKNIKMFYQILGDSIRFVQDRGFEERVLADIYFTSFINNIANVYLRNYKEKDIYQLFLKGWGTIEENYPEYTNKVIKNYQHIKPALSSRAKFYVVAIALQIYKKVKGD